MESVSTSFHHIFTSFGQVGRTGPSLEQCQAAYPEWAQDEASFTVDNGYQIWTVPVSGFYKIEAFGASPPDQTHESNHQLHGGRGAQVQGCFLLSSGEQLTILVGQKPKQSSFNGGGGGTFVTLGSNRATAQPLIIAGGGGSYRCGCGFTKGDANAIMDANGRAHGKHSHNQGGVNGQGGSANEGGGAGAGLEDDGPTPGGVAAQSFRNGGVGGLFTGHNSFEEGGFGGGGGGGWGGSGGGGGYSGGGGPENRSFPPAGGGGSFISGSDQQTSSGSCGWKGEGKAVITFISRAPLDSFSDSVVLVGGEEVPVASQVLRLASPVFDAMFNSSMLESQQHRIEIDVISSKAAFTEFYNWMLPGMGRMMGMSAVNFEDLTTLSDYYQVPFLQTECLGFMDQLPASVSLLMLAHRLKLDAQYEKLIQEVSANIDKYDISLLKGQSDIMMDMLLRMQKIKRDSSSAPSIL